MQTAQKLKHIQFASAEDEEEDEEETTGVRDERNELKVEGATLSRSRP